MATWQDTRIPQYRYEENDSLNKIIQQVHGRAQSNAI